MNYSIIQESRQHHPKSLMMSRILRIERSENSGSEEPSQSIPLPCFSVRARRKSLDDKISLMSTNNHALGIWTCTELAWQFRVFSDSLGEKNQSWIVNFRAEVCVKARDQRKRANISYTERKTEECFQRKTIGSSSRRDGCGFLHTHAKGDREDNVE